MKESYETNQTSKATFLKCRGHTFKAHKEDSSIKFVFNNNEALQKDLTEFKLDGLVPVQTFLKNHEIIMNIIKELMKKEKII